MTIELKGLSKKSNRVIVPLLVTGATLDFPIIGHKSIGRVTMRQWPRKPRIYPTWQIVCKFPMMYNTNLSALFDTALVERKACLSIVKTCNRDTAITAGGIAKLSCLVNAGFFERDIPVVFENDVMCLFPQGISINESLLNLKRDNCSRENLVCKSISTHDFVLRARTTSGSIHLMRAVMPAAVKPMEDDGMIGLSRDQE